MPRAHKPPRPFIPYRLRLAVFTRDRWTCQGCRFVATGRFRMSFLVCDHAMPLVAGGPTTLKNLQAMCSACNAKKGAKVPS